MTTYQLRAKNVSLTYPQCDLDKEYLFQQLHARCGAHLSGLLLAIERHADGNTHFHAYIRFHEPFSTRDPRYFDVDDFHPNVQACRSPRSWIRYCLKEDPEPRSHGIELAEYQRTPGQRISDTLARRLDSGEALASMYKEFPGFLLLNMRKVLEFQSFVTRQSLRGQKADFSLLSHLSSGAPGNEPLVQWLNDNIRKERPLRTPQLWLYSPPGAGKTSLVMELEKYLMVYWVPQDMDFLDGFDDEYDLIVFDEMKSQKKLTWLNQFIVGSPMTINVKGSSVQKKRNVPVIFLSNSHPEVTYPKDTPQRQAFLDRLLILNLDLVRVTFMFKN